MTLLSRITVMSALSLAAATAAHADTRDFLNRCSPGALRACASLSVTTTLNGSGGTSVVIRVRNLQGAAAWLGDNTAGSMITRIGIVTPKIAGLSGGLSVTTSGGAGTVGSPSAAWFLRNPGIISSPIELTAGINTSTSRAGIAGCDAPYGGYGASYYETCNGGWVEFAFTTTNAWSANDAELAWMTTNVVHPSGAGVECDTGGATAGRELCAAVTPEPASLVLIGTGLAGLSGMGFMRRRRDTAEVV